SDAILFYEGRWLNDMCILYYFDVILNEKYSKHSGWDQVLLLDPCTAFAIRFEEDEDDLAQLIDGLKLAQRRCLIVPINDSDDPTLPCGGSHWSLLVLSRTAPSKPWAGVYYDSAPGREMPGKLTGVGDIQTTVGECSKQTNCSDCGMYVLEFAERVLRMFLEDVEMSLLDITTNLISALRKSVLASIRKNNQVFL
ncbi:Sentrin-specific protease, putative, partial [Perkinsus marinus ATCC 50983]